MARLGDLHIGGLREAAGSPPLDGGVYLGGSQRSQRYTCIVRDGVSRGPGFDGGIDVSDLLDRRGQVAAALLEDLVGQFVLRVQALVVQGLDEGADEPRVAVVLDRYTAALDYGMTVVLSGDRP